MDRWARAARLMEQYQETCSRNLRSNDGRYDGHEIRYHILELCRDCLDYASEIGLGAETNSLSAHKMVAFARKYVNTVELIEHNIDEMGIIIKGLNVLGTIDWEETIILRWVHSVFNVYTGWIGPADVGDHRYNPRWQLTPLAGNSPSIPASLELGDDPSSPPPPDTQGSQA